MYRSVFAFLSGIFSILFACSKDKTPPVPSIVNASTKTYLALGDSYTIGESIPESGRWSVQLVQKIRNQNIKINDPDIIARTGWTTSELSSAIKASQNVNKYSMVSLLIGVNNQYRGQSIESYRIEFKTLLATAISFADENPTQVFVLSIPDWGVTPYAKNMDRQKIAKEIDAFNAVAADECMKANIVFIDITSISKTALDDNSMIASDGLHFSAKMYELWADKALQAALKITSK